MSTSSPQGWQHLGKYELRERLGRGGMAEVWKAFDTQLQRYVAIKLLHTDLQTDPEFIIRFTREARVIASLHHPNIVQIYDFQTTYYAESNVPVAYMVMEYVEGQTLAQYIRATSRTGKFPPPIDIVHLFVPISKAIDYAHQQGMIHRDIKPANILLDKRKTDVNPMGEPVLTDFGIAKLMFATSGTISGMWLGTPMYLSPEQAQGYPGNERSDIYSLGVVLYEICTGVQPFLGESATAIMMQHINSMPSPPALINPNIPPALTMVILRAMAKEPAARFSSACTMTAALAEAFNLPVPADLPLPAFPSDNIGGPTYLSSSQSNLSPHRMPPGELSSPPAILATPPFTASPKSGPGFPVTPTSSTPALPSFGSTAHNAQDAPTSYLAPVKQSPTSFTFWREWKRLLFILLAILLILAVSTIGALYLFPAKHTSPPTISMAGEVTFFDSGQLNAQNSQGVDDEVQVNLHNVPNPAPGTSYYAWLKNAPIGAEGTWTLLGPLQVNQGNAQLSSPYQDPQHADLLVNASSFLVTEDSSTISPTQPSADHSTWRFYSEPAQLTLTHLRHLLAGSPELNLRQLYGGLGIWFWRNTEKIVEWAGSARDDVETNPPATDVTHRQLIRILDYIDGAAAVSMDVPPNTPLLVSQHDAQVAVVGPAPQLEPPGSLYNKPGEVIPGYVYLMRVHLDAAVSAPQATAQQRKLATQIENAINQVTAYLEQARQNARQLVSLNSTQLATPQALSLLNAMVVAAQSAYTGSITPGQSQGGATWIYTNLQGLATFAVQPYTAA
jgi:serine/threonine protein kinase